MVRGQRQPSLETGSIRVSWCRHTHNGGQADAGGMPEGWGPAGDLLRSCPHLCRGAARLARRKGVEKDSVDTIDAIRFDTIDTSAAPGDR
jgi:hypothetical protein